MGQASFALIYCIFAAFFAYFNIRGQRAGLVGEMFKATVGRMERRPFELNYPLYVNDIANPNQLLQWLTRVVVPTTYSETLLPGEPQWCSGTIPCSTGEGGCLQNTDCEGTDVCDTGKRIDSRVIVNGVEWKLDDVVAFCQERGTPIDATVGAVQSCGLPPTAAPGVPLCCWEPVTSTYITVLLPIPGATYTVPSDRVCNADVPATSDCCVMSGGAGVSEESSRSDPALFPVLGSFNAPILYRFQLRRFGVTENDRGRFQDDFPTRLIVPMHHASSERERGQYTDDFEGPNKTYVWRKSGSLNEAGGYTEFFNPKDGREAMLNHISELEDADWFNAQMANFVFDMLVFNSNAKAYLHAGWTFAFTHAGSVEIKTFAVGFGSEAMEPWSFIWILRFGLLFITCIFLLVEVKKMTMNFAGHFKYWSAIFDLVSLLLCLTVLIFSFVLSSHEIYDSGFSLDEVPTIAEESDVNATIASPAGIYRKLEELGELQSASAYLVALNLLFVSCRAVIILAVLDDELGLIFSTIDHAKENLISLVCMFLMIILGFVAFAFFLFGGNSLPEEFGSTGGSVFQTFTMLIGHPNYELLSAADSVMAPVFFYTFYVLMYFVMINMFISILMNGYDQATEMLKAKEKKLKEENKTRANIFTQIINDFRASWVGAALGCGKRIWTCLRKVGQGLKESFADCLAYCPRRPTPPSLNARSFWRSSGGGGAANVTGKPSAGSTKQCLGLKRGQVKALEFLQMAVFLIIFITFINLQTRGSESFQNGMAASFTSRHAIWATSDPVRVNHFESIESMEDVLGWARTAMSKLYGNPYCAVYPTDKPASLEAWTSKRPEEPLHQITGFECDNTLNDQMVVNIVRGWNIAFLNTTFVRLTIQPACYTPNYDQTTRDVAPYVRKTPDVMCSGTDCTTSDVLDTDQCYNSQGEPIDFNMLRAHRKSEGGTDEYYNYSKPGDLGPHGLDGGIAVSLGVRITELWDRLEDLEYDGWFTKNSASMVFDYITYNGNLDVFAYNKVTFDLLESGDLRKNIDMSIFPLHIFSGGGYYRTERLVAAVLVIIYFLFLLYYTGQQVRSLYLLIHYREQEPFYQPLIRYYSNPWNGTDTISLIISIVSMALILTFSLNTFRADYKFSVTSQQKYEIPNDDVKEFSMVSEVDPARSLQEDWYIFYNFEQLASLYGNLLTIAALNCFFISIKVVKYVTNRDAVKVFSGTFSDGARRTTYFVVVLVLLILGWALYFSVLYGRYDEGLSSLGPAMVTLVNWLLGVETPLNLLRIDELVLLWWGLYMILFYFIMTNMFLATMMNQYADTVGKKDIQKTRDEVRNMLQLRQVVYDSIDQFKADIVKISINTKDSDKFPEWDVIVEEVNGDSNGIAKKAGICPGHIIYKVNHEQHEWKKSGNPEEIKTAIAKNMDDRDLSLRITFKEPPKDESGLGKFLEKLLWKGKAKEVEGIKANNKNFWQQHGAVTWIYRKVLNAERRSEHQEEEQYPEEEEEDDDDDAAMDDKDGEAQRFRNEYVTMETMKKNARQKVKNQLSQLLFSRAVKLRFDEDASQELERTLWATPDQVLSKQDMPKQEDPTNPKFKDEEELDIDELRELLEKLPVTGVEVWLDCLVTAIEREWNDESLVTEVLRTSDMQDLAGKKKTGGNPTRDKTSGDFYINAHSILQTLEFKARKKYYKKLEEESLQRQTAIGEQNKVLFKYVCELEEEFKKIMGAIHSYKGKKRVMLKKLADLLGGDYSTQRSGEKMQEKTHMARLTVPWPEARGGGRN